MLIDSDKTKTRSFESDGDRMPVADTDESEKMGTLVVAESELFDLYEKIAKTRSGTRDAEIFEKIHEWSFSDFSIPPHEFAGITKIELSTWQTRNRINLSAGHIRPAPIDLDRGHAWGQMRRAAHVNGIHSHIGPPSAEELRQILISKSE